MRIVLSGGGTGGHITPILAVAREIKQKNPRITVIYVGERHGKFRELTDECPDIDRTYEIFAGKYRRYNGRSIFENLFDVKTNLKNFRDIFYQFFGLVQSWRLFFREKPDAVFLKGGFVGVPVGIASWIRGIPFITHDSDVVPGLANRIVGRWALYHAVARRSKNYPYPQPSVKPVGVIVGRDYKPIDAKSRAVAKKKIGIPVRAKVLLATGGSSGALRINEYLKVATPRLLDEIKDLVIIHQVGKGNLDTYGKFQHKRLVVLEFLNPMHDYMAAADLIVTRAGANALAEMGVQGKAAIVVPASHLTDGHQLKNAEFLSRKQAAVVVKEGVLYKLEKIIKTLMSDAKKRELLGQRLQEITPIGAADKIADLLLRVADKYDIEK